MEHGGLVPEQALVRIKVNSPHNRAVFPKVW
jgi:hypothetical protein